MTFGPFLQEECFPIEKSNVYKSIRQDVKMAEFLLFKGGDGNTVWVVEAKSSAPQPKTQPNFQNFLSEILEKWVNAFSLTWASRLGRHQQAEPELPDRFKSFDLSKAEVRCVLVIKGFPKQWLPPLQETLGKNLRPFAKTWRFGSTPVAVLNEADAIKHGLIRT